MTCDSCRDRVAGRAGMSCQPSGLAHTCVSRNTDDGRDKDGNERRSEFHVEIYSEMSGMSK